MRHQLLKRTPSASGVIAQHLACRRVTVLLRQRPECESSNAYAVVELTEATMPQLQWAFTNGIITSHDLVARYLARINAYDQRGPTLNAISVINGKTLAEADARDAERRTGRPRSPLHGVPIIVKDNYDTSDLQTAAGSRSLAGWIPPDDAFLVTKLGEAGAISLRPMARSTASPGRA